MSPQLIVMEYIDNGSLENVISKRPDELTDSRVVKILRDVADGMVRQILRSEAHTHVHARTTHTKRDP
jgi:serine/threonine protein kinase